MSMHARGKGRRRKGTGNSKEEILLAALDVFARNGFDRTTVRAVAKEAMVDPALVFHFFGSKDRLFVEAMRSKMHPPGPAELQPSGDLEDHGVRIARLFLERWGGDRGRTPFLGLIRSATSNPRAAEMLRQLFEDTITPWVSRTMGPEDADLRVALVGSQLLGIGAMRYVLRIEPLASASIEEVALSIGPAITQYLRNPRGERTRGDCTSGRRSK